MLLITAALASPLALLGMLMAMDRIQGRLEPGPDVTPVAGSSPQDEMAGATTPALPDFAAA
jgi:hypothetical protein